MNRDVLSDQVGELAHAVVSDPRFDRDDLSVSVLGMILYGYALALGRLYYFLDVPEIDSAVLSAMTNRIGAAAKWSSGLVAEANTAAFNKEHHPGHHELVGVGHSYLGVDDNAMLLDNVFANIARIRKRLT